MAWWNKDVIVYRKTLIAPQTSEFGTAVLYANKEINTEQRTTNGTTQVRITIDNDLYDKERLIKEVLDLLHDKQRHVKNALEQASAALDEAK